MPNESDENYTCFQSILSMALPIVGAIVASIITLLPQQTAIDVVTTSYGLGLVMVCIGFPLSLMVVLMVLYPTIHLTSKRQGGGSYRGLFVRTQRWNTIAFFLFVMIATVSNFYLLNRSLELIIVSASVIIASTPEYVFQWTETGKLLFIGAGIVWFVWVIALSRVIAQHYKMTKIDGCLAMVLVHFIFSCGFFMIYIGIALQLAYLFTYFM